MTGYNSQVGGGVYRIQFETSNQLAYKTVEAVIRSFVDLEGVAVSKNENTTQVSEASSVGVCPENTKEAEL